MLSTAQEENKRILLTALVDTCARLNSSLSDCKHFSEHIGRVGEDLSMAIANQKLEPWHNNVLVQVKISGIHFDWEDSAMELVLTSEAARNLYFYVVNVNGVDPRGIPFLRVLIVRNNMNALRILLRRKADTKTVDAQGMAPLHYVRTAECARLLLEYGTDPDVKDSNGTTLLLQSFMKFSRCTDPMEGKKIVKILVDAGADVKDVAEEILECRDTIQYKIEYEVVQVRRDELSGYILESLLNRVQSLSTLSEQDIDLISKTHPLYAKSVAEVLFMNTTKLQNISILDILNKSTESLLNIFQHKQILTHVVPFLKKHLLHLNTYKANIMVKCVMLVTRSTLEYIAADVMYNHFHAFCFNHTTAYAILRNIDVKSLQNVICMDRNVFHRMQDDVFTIRTYSDALFHFLRLYNNAVLRNLIRDSIV